MMKYMYWIFLIVWISAIVYFVQNLIRKRTEGSRSRKKKKAGRKRRGKRCPECKNTIDHRREVCQHCGYKFPHMDVKAKDRIADGTRSKSRKRGKRCPGCGNKVDYNREKCQYCGYEFYEFKIKKTDGESSEGSSADQSSS